jgi:uncharacterized repeat protein (TIGR03803 family)
MRFVQSFRSKTQPEKRKGLLQFQNNNPKRFLAIGAFSLLSLSLFLVLIALPTSAMTSLTNLGGTSNNGTAIRTHFASESGRSEQVIYAFKGSNDGSGPNDLISDRAGNLYGTTFDGGPGAAGTVFRLSPPNQKSESWSKTILHNFYYSRLGDGIGPKAGLLMDSFGNLFGSTWLGGPNGGGMVFECSPPSEGGAWVYKMIYDFSAPNDGVSPEAPLVMDSGGNLYGTTVSGGTGACAGGCGIVFRLAPPVRQGLQWTENILYNFPGIGAFPGNGGTAGGVILDARGAVYGTTIAGGGSPYGTVFRLSRQGNTWTHSVLYAFKGGASGSSPMAGLTFDKNGKLYGTTAYGGTSTGCFGTSCGTVFELTPTSTGPWKHAILHAFTGGTDGGNPQSAVVLDRNGNVYGTTSIGGNPACNNPNGCGTVYELVLTGGTFTEIILHRFLGGSDGIGPGAVNFGFENDLYGVAGAGVHGAGLIFSLALGQLPTFSSRYYF